MAWRIWGMGNHRLVEVRRDLWWSSSPTPLLEQGHLVHVAQVHVQVGFDYFQRKILHNLSGQLVPVLCHPHGKKFFLIFKWNLLCFSFCLLLLVLSLGSTKKSAQHHTCSYTHSPMHSYPFHWKNMYSLWHTWHQDVEENK